MCPIDRGFVPRVDFIAAFDGEFSLSDWVRSGTVVHDSDDFGHLQLGFLPGTLDTRIADEFQRLTAVNRRRTGVTVIV
jgi:hypothetical protein